MLLHAVMRFAVVLVALSLAACGSDAEPAGPDAGITPDAYVDQSGPVFDGNHIVEVAITMAPADWDALRVQTRTIGSIIEGDCLAQPAASPFDTFHAQITIDGTTFPDVGIKKKGFLGSLDDTKPSLKVKLDEYVAGTEYLGLEKLTLNNSHQDPSLLRQCLTYPVFVATGSVAPRCNFAHVTVNGRNLGIYVNVESIDHHLTKKRYADGTGNLYEGTLSDFRKDWLGTFDAKGGGTGADLVPIAQVLETSPDATLVADLAPHLDVDRFITYWATEIITNHWDGYANNRNNFIIYHDPTTNKLEFIPWGPDGAMQRTATFGNLGSTTGPVAVAANGILAHRLFAIPANRQQLLDRERQLLATHWDEAALLAEITRMEQLITPIADAAQGTTWHASVTDLRAFVTDRRAKLTAAINAGPTWTDPLPAYPCLAIAAHVTGTFSTTWGTINATNPFTTGTGTMSITIGGTTTTLTPVGAKAGFDPNPPAGQPARAIVQAFGVRATDNHIIAVSMSVPPLAFFPREADLGFFDSFGIVFDFDPGTNQATQIGFMLGKLRLTQASTANGAQVAGSFDANADVQGVPP